MRRPIIAFLTAASLIIASSPVLAAGKTSGGTKLPTSFSDLYQNRAGISSAAWTAVSTTIASSTTRSITLQILTGPHTKPYYDNYPLVTKLVNKAFPDYGIPSKLVVLRYNYTDLPWAETTMRALVTQPQYDALQLSEGGHLVDGNCDAVQLNCNGSRENAIDQSTGLILQGVPNTNTDSARLSTGQLEAHEYFHELQRQTQWNKPAAFSPWGLRWFLEGSAEWTQNAVVNYGSLSKYTTFLKNDCQGTCRTMTEASILDYLQMGDQANTKYEQWLSYNLGSRVVEVLVALKGQEVILQMMASMASGNSFETAFYSAFGTPWSTAMPIIAQTLAANIAAGR